MSQILEVECCKKTLIINRRQNSKSLFRRFAAVVAKPIKYFDRFFRYRHLRSFISQNFSISQPLYSSADFNDFIRKHHLKRIVIGSDQVWREGYCPQIEDYFLIARPESTMVVGYAISFGGEKFNGCVNKYEEFVQKISALSFRETQAVNWHNEFFNPAAINVLDPALLLSEEHYVSSLGLNVDNKNSRGYAYILDFESWKERIINEFSERNLLDFDYFSISGKKNLSALFDPLSFEGWVNSFFSASYIITDSFHGMVLAIKFKKPFLVLANEKRGVERFTSLLSALALENRIFYKKSISPDNNEVEEIDWKLVSRETEKLKNISVEFLKDALNDP